jgi:SAM-dependent methyltransferase
MTVRRNLTPAHRNFFMKTKLQLRAVLLTALFAVTPLPFSVAAEAAKAAETPAKPKTPDVIYVPTPQSVVDKMLEMAEVKPGDVVYDLGCGDGRIVVTAAKKFGVKAMGFDIDPQRVKEARENVRAAGVEHLVTILETDIFTLDLREASVITLYLLPDLNVRLMPQLAVLKPGSRIVSHDFDMKGAKPVATHRMQATFGDGGGEQDGDIEHTIYKWVVPWEKEPAKK